jgi:hypothetical protein
MRHNVTQYPSPAHDKFPFCCPDIHNNAPIVNSTNPLGTQHAREGHVHQSEYHLGLYSALVCLTLSYRSSDLDRGGLALPSRGDGKATSDEDIFPVARSEDKA